MLQVAETGNIKRKALLVATPGEANPLPDRPAASSFALPPAAPRSTEIDGADESCAAPAPSPTVPADPAHLPVSISGPAYEPQSLQGDAFERMQLDPEIAQIRKKLRLGIGITLALAVLAALYQWLSPEPPAELALPTPPPLVEPEPASSDTSPTYTSTARFIPAELPLQPPPPPGRLPANSIGLRNGDAAKDAKRPPTTEIHFNFDSTAPATKRDMAEKPTQPLQLKIPSAKP
jgi:hypothetical protein